MGQYDEIVCRFPVNPEAPAEVHLTLDYLAGGPARSQLGPDWEGPGDHGLFAQANWRQVLGAGHGVFLFDMPPRTDDHFVQVCTSLKWGAPTFVVFLAWIEPWTDWGRLFEPWASDMQRWFAGYMVAEVDRFDDGARDTSCEVPTLIYLSENGFELEAAAQTAPRRLWEGVEFDEWAQPSTAVGGSVPRDSHQADDTRRELAMLRRHLERAGERLESTEFLDPPDLPSADRARVMYEVGKAWMLVEKLLNAETDS